MADIFQESFAAIPPQIILDIKGLRHVLDLAKNVRLLAKPCCGLLITVLVIPRVFSPFSGQAFPMTENSMRREMRTKMGLDTGQLSYHQDTWQVAALAHAHQEITLIKKV
jgi:hypothetical protein